MTVHDLINDVPELVREYLNARNVEGSEAQSRLAAKAEALHIK